MLDSYSLAAKPAGGERRVVRGGVLQRRDRGGPTAKRNIGGQRGFRWNDHDPELQDHSLQLNVVRKGRGATSCSSW